MNKRSAAPRNAPRDLRAERRQRRMAGSTCGVSVLPCGADRLTCGADGLTCGVRPVFPTSRV
ncbi:MAG TPA: hypothetical protein VKK31_09725 [Thermoanaerobaculia bacterium]|nr:hypothetical protein [Thermoanaerobaculia bacterium]